MMRNKTKAALIYCEGEFGKVNGKVANGLVRNSQKYVILGVIDSSLKDKDSGEVLDGKPNGIQIYGGISEGLRFSSEPPTHFIFGIASGAGLGPNERAAIISAISLGLDIVSGLTEFLSEDEELIGLAKSFGVRLIDVRKPPERKYLHSFTGKILQVSTPVVAVLGTGCATGKRTTAVQLVKELTEGGLKATFIATGQTGLMQGAKYGVAVDMLSSGIASGEIEHAVYSAFIHEQPDIIIIEGQGSLSHPSYTSSHAIIKGALPNAIILQHPPKRKHHGDFPEFSMPKVRDEIRLVEQFSNSKVLAIAINTENMDANSIIPTINEYEKIFGIPTADVLTMTCSKIIRALYSTFPQLELTKPKTPRLLN
jgi:uncharacterized NAD-dependent epimerase/dehydratase family protein